ncbi:putative metal-dependent hydrolase of the TIM-barrel fold protein [Piscirickettsia salmonis]|nr:putative metal-dependent hydrolase of the TIM-barrel fold protein [Piscirickettsia salmonis]QGP58208.1 putative metal-dependent hydrolase of the TIM-barrel fold protein [Piscirickettsia salmonis]QGP65490.1 putative metal-dependent hydrolase of the TIM-barrel fold protein [Piscirickettsia salmonis]
MVTEANLSTWHPSDIYPYIDVIMKCFGDARVMYGSDYPVCLLAATYKQVLDLVVTWFDNHPQFSLENILFNNAQSIYLLMLRSKS